MKRIFGLVLMGVIISASTMAQTVDEVINKYVDATGGRDKISQAKSLYMESTVQVMGNETSSTTTILNGKGYKNESDFNGQKIVQCITDKDAWAITPMGGGAAQPMPEEAAKQGRGQIYIGGPLVDYAAKGYKVALAGKDGNAYKVSVTSADGASSTYYINGTTWLADKIVTKANMMGQEMEASTNFSNFKKTDYGLTLPYAIETKFGEQFTINIAVNKIEVNKPVDPSIFVMPK
jgi:uncharacterized RmlC-like cupin family protein